MAEPDETHSGAGVWCRNCGCVNLWVIQTSHAIEGVIRIRECRACKTKFRSIETYLSAKSGNVCEDYPRIPGKVTTRDRG